MDWIVSSRLVTLPRTGPGRAPGGPTGWKRSVFAALVLVAVFGPAGVATILAPESNDPLMDIASDLAPLGIHPVNKQCSPEEPEREWLAFI